MSIFEFGDANPSEQVHYGSMDPWGSDTAAFRLYQDGEPYAEGRGPLARSRWIRSPGRVSNWT